MQNCKIYKKNLKKSKHAFKQAKFSLLQETSKEYFEQLVDTDKYLVRSFKMIGWADMLYGKEQVEDLEENDLAYPKEMYTLREMPKCIYVPSDEIMTKIMRICLFVRNESELMIYDQD
jgi:hypothetical protein